MKISPLDLRQARFQRAMRGYDPGEVQRFLDLVRIEMEALREENQALRNELQQALRRLSEFREQESLLRDALLTAQRVGEELRTNAERESELIVGDAELKAGRLIGDAMHRVQELRSQIVELRQVKAALRNDIRAHIKRAATWVDLDEQADTESADANVHFFAPATEAQSG